MIKKADLRYGQPKAGRVKGVIIRWRNSRGITLLVSFFFSKKKVKGVGVKKRGRIGGGNS